MVEAAKLIRWTRPAAGLARAGRLDREDARQRHRQLCVPFLLLVKHCLSSSLTSSGCTLLSPRSRARLAPSVAHAARAQLCRRDTEDGRRQARVEPEWTLDRRLGRCAPFSLVVAHAPRRARPDLLVHARPQLLTLSSSPSTPSPSRPPLHPRPRPALGCTPSSRTPHRPRPPPRPLPPLKAFAPSPGSRPSCATTRTRTRRSSCLRARRRALRCGARRPTARASQSASGSLPVRLSLSPFSHSL